MSVILTSTSKTYLVEYKGTEYSVTVVEDNNFDMTTYFMCETETGNDVDDPLQIEITEYIDSIGTEE